MSEAFPPPPHRSAHGGPERARDGAADWLDRALAERGAAHADAYIDDEGFTARVMAHLPARLEPLRWRRPVLTLLWVIALAAFATTLPSTLLDFARGAVRLFAGRPFALSDVATLLVLAGAVMWGATWVAWRRA